MEIPLSPGLSPAWTHYKRLVLPESKKHIPDIVLCGECEKEKTYSVYSATCCSLQKHLKKHGIRFPVKRNIATLDKEIELDSLLEWICLKLVPLNIVCAPEFKGFVQSLNTNFNVKNTNSLFVVNIFQSIGTCKRDSSLNNGRKSRIF